MKNILIIIFLASLIHTSQAQDMKSKLQLNFGGGITTFGGKLYLGADYGIHRDITIGIEGNIRNSEETYQWYKIVGGTLTANYHFNHLFKMDEGFCDIYLGGFANYWLVSPTYDRLTPDSASYGYGGQFGVRHYFTEKFGFHVESQVGLLENKNYLRFDPRLNAALKLGFTYRFSR